MAGGFADILSVLGVWLSGKKVSSPTPSATPAPSPRIQDGNLHVQRWRHEELPTPSMDEDTLEIVRNAIHEELKRSVPDRSDIDSEEARNTWYTRQIQPPTEEDIGYAVGALFSNPLLSAFEQQRMALARQFTEASIHKAFEEQLRDFRFAKDKARRDAEALSEAEDEEVLLLLL